MAAAARCGWWSSRRVSAWSRGPLSDRPGELAEKRRPADLALAIGVTHATPTLQWPGSAIIFAAARFKPLDLSPAAAVGGRNTSDGAWQAIFLENTASKKPPVSEACRVHYRIATGIKASRPPPLHAWTQAARERAKPIKGRQSL